MSKKPEFKVEVGVCNYVGKPGGDWYFLLLRRGHPCLWNDSYYTTRSATVRAAKSLVKALNVDWPIEVVDE